MEYSIYINQKAAVAWDLSMAESLLFGYLVSSGGWMASLPSLPEYKWASNSKLATELPLVCAHKGSARRHMKTLEEKGLIARQTVGNKSYFKITDKGNYWRSDSLPKANETVDPSGQGERNGSPKANETVDPKANETVDQSDIPLISDRPNQKDSVVDFAMVVNLYNEMLPELPFIQLSRWKKDSTRAKSLAARWKEEPACKERDFWIAFFEEVQKNDFWMRRQPAGDGRYFEGCNLGWLLTPKRFDEVVEKAMDRERREAANVS